MVRRYRSNPRNCPHCLGQGLVYNGICSFCHGSGQTDRTSWVQRNPCVSCALALAMLRRRNPDWAEFVEEDDLGMLDQADDEALPIHWQRNPNEMGWVCNNCGEDKEDVAERHSLDLYAGRYCDECWENSGYRKEGAEGFDPLDAGESYDDDY